MPDIDVSDLITDPDFADEFVVTRQVQTVGANGRTVVTTESIPMVGVIHTGVQNEFGQTPEYINAQKSITVICLDRIYDPVTGHSPDIITWEEDSYLVKKAYNWSRQGQGFWVAECDLKTSVGQ